MPDIGQILDVLERDGALELESGADDEWPWPEAEPGDSIVQVDHARLFPRTGPTDRGNDDFDLFGDGWPLTEDDVESILGGAPNASTEPPVWDVWAWYQPIHYFGGAWGIFIKEAALKEFARRIARRLKVPPYPSPTLAKAVMRCAFAGLFLHEQYHHKTESLALRLHVVERRPIYPDYHRLAYRPTRGTPDQVEEGLANADSWYRMPEQVYARWTGPTVNAVGREYLADSFRRAPPGYSNATHLLAKPAFDEEQRVLFARVQEGAISPSRTTTSDFAIATHLNRSLFNLTQRIWTVIPAGTRSVLPTHPAIAPLATTQLERLIKRRGWRPVPGGGKGSHRKFRNGGGMIVLPTSKDVSMPVLSSTADTLGVSVHELKKLVR